MPCSHARSPPPVRQNLRSPQVQAIALRTGNSPTTSALGGAFLVVNKTAGEQSASSSSSRRDKTPGRDKQSLPRTSSSSSNNSSGGATTKPLPAGFPVPDTPPTTLFFMRSHAQPIVLACHRTRWLVLSWASTGPHAAETLQRATDPGSVAESARAAEAAVRRLSLAVDHLSYLRAARPFLAGCVAYWLWEHGGVRAHVGMLARWLARGDNGDNKGTTDGGAPGTGAGAGTAAAAATALVEEGRPAREAFLAAAEEFLKVEALFPERRDGQERGARGGDVGGRGKGQGSEVSFMSLLTEGAMQRCPWPGAWDRWVEECLRDAQVNGVAVTRRVGVHIRVHRCSSVSFRAWDVLAVWVYRRLFFVSCVVVGALRWMTVVALVEAALSRFQRVIFGFSCVPSSHTA